MSLTSQIEALEQDIQEKKKELATLRDQLQPEEVKDYTFLNWDRQEVKLSDLFGDKDELILVWNMGKSCPYCTLWADGYNGLTGHLSNRAAFAVVSPDAPEVQKEFATSRGWKFDLLSRSENTFGKDFDMEDDKGHHMPGVSIFLKKEGKLYHHSKTFFGPGDNFCVMWDFIDLLPSQVRWAPKYTY